jgi:hypothetical protein
LSVGITASVLVVMSSAGFIVTVTIRTPLDGECALPVSAIIGVMTITHFQFGLDPRQGIGRREWS